MVVRFHCHFRVSILQEISHQQDPQAGVEAKELSQGCLSSTGRTTLELTRDFQVLGAHACDNCKLLKKVDVSNTKIAEIQEFTFVHCASLCEIKLPYTLHTIRAKAFMNCAALPEIAIPPSLHYIASRAFLDCTALRRLVNSRAVINGEEPTQNNFFPRVRTPCGRVPRSS